MPETVRIVIYRKGERYIAQGIEVDINAQGHSVEEAKRRFAIALHATIDDAKNGGRALESIGPAPDRFRAMYESPVVSRDEMSLAA